MPLRKKQPFSSSFSAVSLLSSSVMQYILSQRMGSKTKKRKTRYHMSKGNICARFDYETYTGSLLQPGVAGVSETLKWPFRSTRNVRNIRNELHEA
ncbi:uncharacterized protein BDW43DRAFT_277902 [Aspergillus alliaceus]|uniref:uncharacterized protein n=1 Tax=Petromyces alliaceus TaxID=209559 RepID=UPI0012A7465E|nr:uncharacterized protein BDW43DRAFT_277902 [Aspergillus alliaceus]KAB8232914.1 hypothetical protein BDW43DRAFT_277902 [Aspergillus alliaceus]